MPTKTEKSDYRYVALGDVTVHKLLMPETKANLDPSTNNAPCVSVILTKGESLGESELPYYVKEFHENGGIPLLSKVSEAKASRMAKNAEEDRVLEESTLASSVIQTTQGDATSSGPGRIGDIPGVIQEDGQTLFVSGDNSGYGQDTGTQTETVEI